MAQDIVKVQKLEITAAIKDLQTLFMMTNFTETSGVLYYSHKGSLQKPPDKLELSLSPSCIKSGPLKSR